MFAYQFAHHLDVFPCGETPCFEVLAEFVWPQSSPHVYFDTFLHLCRLDRVYHRLALHVLRRYLPREHGALRLLPLVYVRLVGLHMGVHGYPLYVLKLFQCVCMLDLSSFLHLVCVSPFMS